MPSVRIKQLLASLAIVGYLFITYILIYYLKNPVLRAQLDTLIFLAVLSGFYLIPVILFAAMMGILSALALIILITAVMLIEVSVTGYLFFLNMPVICLVFVLLLWLAGKNRQSLLLSYEVEVEKNVATKNELEIRLKEKSEAVNSYFDRYSRFYNLRKVAEDFATSLALGKLGDMIVERCLGFVRKGEHCLLYVLEPDGVSLALVASKSILDAGRAKKKQGDILDLWVVKNRQHLLVPDLASDYRFNIEVENLESLQGVMISPLLSQGRVIGILRVNTREKNALTSEDLRLLDLISSLAASALANAILYQKTEDLAIRDSLTSLFVQRYFKERLKEEHRRALLSHSALSVIMCDLDYFKTYNDRLGHGAGDLVLKGIADILVEKVGPDGIVARYGGEEFSILLPKMEKTRAVYLAEELRKAIEARQFMLRNESTRITASFGVSSLPQDTLEQEDLLRLADDCLYLAKRSGRNRACSSES